ncbi:bacteriocin-protection protein [Vagococcus coleopterorum]|uniref:Bacteriocin-protection protein n=1 Tax=Vagococcus coleopterorum TaxID=2714946 RepID=A0A6G8AMI1_9ENTE|nr:YdeI/OmpD-associated family protein [Vagococcus coleopterorum]QIL46207.1 bacteriocin-protection protein [Vagococcus coleopterorum]
MSDSLFFTTQIEFTNWLEDHHLTSNELWVGFYKQKSKKVSISWSESVDCALAFGWIDGIRKSIDEESYKIRFTPRKPNSVWSKINVEKVQKLIELNQMRPEGLALFNQRKDQIGYSSVDRNVDLPTDYHFEITKNIKALAFYNQLPPSYKRDSIWWVMSAKKEETQLRRLHRLITAWEEKDMLRP